MKTKELAAIILNAADAHEAAYDHAAAQAAADSGSFVDYSQFYKRTLQESCELIAGEFSTPVYLLLKYTWNDACAWAQEQIK